MRHITTRAAGLIILIAGIWGGLIPFVGPYFHFALGPDHTWTWSSSRLYLSVLPGIAAAVGGLWLMIGGPRLLGRIGALLALAGGAWFAIGPDVSRLWHTGGAQGLPHGRGWVRMLEYVTLHTGLGVLIVALAAFSLPGIVVARRRAVARAETETAAPAVAADRDEVAPREEETVPAA